MICVTALLLCQGFGTLEEFFEMLTWARTSQKIAVLNTNGFYDALIVLLETGEERLFEGS
jgi:predicted Rossmann-fold nucleotide-binding protein